MLPPGTANRHRQPSNGDDRARWKAGKGMIRRLWPRPYTWNGGWQQKRPFPRSEFQVEANSFHLERPNGTGRPPTATTVPGGGAEKGNGTGKPPKRMSVPDGKTRRTRMDSSLPRPFTWNGGQPQKRPFPDPRSRWKLFASTRNGQSAPTVLQRRRPCQVEGQKGTTAPAVLRRERPYRVESQKIETAPAVLRRRRSCQVESQKQGRLNKKTAGLCSPAVLKLIALILT